MYVVYIAVCLYFYQVVRCSTILFTNIEHSVCRVEAGSPHLRPFLNKLYLMKVSFILKARTTFVHNIPVSGVPYMNPCTLYNVYTV